MAATLSPDLEAALNLRDRTVAETRTPISSGTLSLDEAAAQEWDALVIGAGVAGTLAARQLASGGVKTLLIEGKSLPRQKVCGGCLSASLVDLLAEIGLPDLCDQLEASTVRHLEIHRAGRRLTVPLPAGRALSRAALDAALAGAAIKAGADFVPRVRAQVTPVLAHDRDFRSVRLQSHDDATGIVRAKVIVVADGLGHSSLQQLPEYASRVDPQSLVGLGTLIPGDAASLEDFPAGKILMALGSGGYVGMVRVEQNQLNVAAAVDKKLLHAFSGNCKAMTSKLLRQAGYPAPEGLSESGWLGTLSLTRSTPCVASDRIFVIGDAAGYVEPFTGEGMSWAAQAAIAISPLVQRAVRNWDDSLTSAWVRSYRSLVGRNHLTCRMLATVLRRPILSATAMRLAATFPGFTASVVQRLNRPLGSGVRSR